VTQAPSLVWREGDSIRRNKPAPHIKDLDSLPMPNRDGLDWNRYVPSPGTGNYMQLPSSGILASRGCPYNCNYCSKGVFHRTIRFRSPEHVIREIEFCIERYGIRDFRFYDDVLTYSKWDLQRFCELLLSKNLNITWNCYSRVNFITMDKLQMMKRAGCYHIKYGIEFGTEKSLKTANKQATLEQAREAVRLTKEAGIECKGNFILGIPGETVEDCEATIRFARELSPDLVSFYPYDAFPGTHFFIVMDEGGNSGELLSREQTEALASKAYLSFYVRPAYMLQRARRIYLHPKRELQLIWNGMSMMTKFYLKNNLLFSHARRAPLS
jgi:anaerobic magnesium-protoporphyrin IX monomethyl ester cyclase